MVLMRRPGEEIVFEVPGVGNMRLKVVSIDANQVKLGFEGPRSVKVWRHEIFTRIVADRLEGTL